MAKTSNELSIGMHGPDSIKLKLELLLLGIEPYTVGDSFSAALSNNSISLADFDIALEKAVRDFQGSAGLEVTGVIDPTTSDRLHAAAQKSDQFAVAGVVRDHNNDCCQKVVVAASDKDLRKEEELGKTVTNALGEFAIFYDRTNFCRGEKESADLVLTATDLKTNLSVSSDIHFNASHVEIIDIKLKDDAEYEVPEYDRYIACLKPVLGDIALHDLTEDDVRFLHGESGIPLRHLNFLQLDATLSEACELENGVFYAWMRQGVPTVRERLFAIEISRLKEAFERSIEGNIVPGKLLAHLDEAIEAVQKQTRPIKADLLKLNGHASFSPNEIKARDQSLYQKLVDTTLLNLGQTLDDHFAGSSDELQYHIHALDLTNLIEEQKPVKEFLREMLSEGNLSKAAVQEGLAKINDLKSPETAAEILQPEAPLQNNPLFVDKLRQASVFRLGALADLGDDKVEQLLSRGFGPESIGPDALSNLVEEGVLDDGEAKELGLNANLYQFAGTDLTLVNAVKGLDVDRPLTSLRDLARLNRSDWQSLLEDAQIDSPLGASRAEYAAFLRKQIEALFPHDVFRLQHRPVDEGSVAQDLDQISPLFADNERLFNGTPFSALNLTGIDANSQSEVEDAYARLSRLTNRYPGLHLNAVLADGSSSAQEKLAEASRRVNLMEDFYKAHEDLRFLSLDYSPDSEDLERLDLAAHSEADRRLIVNNLKADQRVYRATQDAEHAHLLMESGYHAAYQITSDSYRNFVRATGLEAPVAKQYYRSAQAITNELTARFGTILDYEIGGLDWMAVDNASTEIHLYLRRLEGYSDWFGNLDYCKCKHCQSIISPAAYFVDLMDFLKVNVMEEHFSGANSDHELSPWVRRRDLWESLPLTCECTHTLVPYLAIILEILENYIASQRGSGFTGSLSDRDAVVAFVYRTIYERSELNSFHQPFHLPLAEFETYLNHFPISRAQIARTVLAYQVDTNAIIPQSELMLSGREYDLIAAPNTDAAFLNDLYRISVPVSETDPPEAKDLLHAMGISRQALTELVETRFVTADGAATIEILGVRGDGALQPDREEVRGLSPAVLDRMHRFTRLWRQLDWSIGELDQVLHHVRSAGIEADPDQLPLAVIVQLSSLQEELKVDIPELCALFHEIPTIGDPSFFDRLFNLPSFARAESLEDPGSLSVPFRHPAYRSDLPDPSGPGARIQHRLRAGLGIDDDQLFQLIEHLRGALSVDSDDTFILNLQTLTRLYRHARLTRAFGVSVRELFALIRLAPEISVGYLAQLSDLRALASLVDWQSDSGYSVRELAHVLGDSYGDAEVVHTPAEISERIIDQALAEQSLIFADTVFSYFEGITEAQSQAVIAENSSYITPADIRVYRIAASVSDPATLTITIPRAIRDTLTGAQQASLIEVVRDIIATHQRPGAPDISDRVLVGTVDLTLAQSRAILEAHASIFEPVENPNLYWLSPDFDPNGTVAVAVPDGVPLRSEPALDFLKQFSAAEVIANGLSREFSLPVGKTKIMALIAGYDLSSTAVGRALTRIVHEETASTELDRAIEALRKLGIWFKDSSFDAEALAFIESHSGGIESVFHATNYRNPVLANVQQTVRFQRLLKSSEGQAQALFSALEAFDYADSQRFRDAGLDDLTETLQTERGLVDALNRVLGFPASTDTATGDPVNHALDALDKLGSCVELAQFLGVGGEALPLLISEDYGDLHQAVAVIVTAIRTKSETEEIYQERIEPFEDKIRERKRDALTDYLIHSLAPDTFESVNDLYHHFLIDTELEGCARTSKVVAGISSLQLYIQRVIMNLEQTEVRVMPQLRVGLPKETLAQWEWRKNYRVWEANRKVFFYPENYIEPDLRDNKTPLFEELESELLQQEIDAQSVLDAYAKYMKGFEEIARLKIAGAYHDRSGAADVLHLFGVTSSEPPEYYYRTIENIYKAEEAGCTKGIVWHPWRKLNLQIPVRKVSPIVYRGRLYVFWVEISTRPINQTIAGSSRFAGYKHTMAVQFTTLRLDSTWTAPQRIALTQSDTFSAGDGIIPDPLVEQIEMSDFTGNYFLEHYSLDAGISDWGQEALATIVKSVQNNPSILDISDPIEVKFFLDRESGKRKYEDTVNFNSGVIRNLFTPRYTSEIHVEPVDGYTLTGYQWDQVYPHGDSEYSWLGPGPTTSKLMLVGRDFQMTSHVDLYSLSIRSAESLPFPIVNFLRSLGLPIPSSFKRLNRTGDDDLYFGYIPEFSQGTAFADAIHYLENQRNDLVSRAKLLRLRGEERIVTLINGTLTDCFIDVDGDLLYLHSFDRDRWSYMVKRTGTTLSEQVARKLFEGGVDNLLDLNTQKRLKEASLPLPIEDLVYNDSNEGELDFKGSLGVYYREIFFHIPYLIANHLNSQGKYADAQRWYHYIFDPTSNKLPTDLDRISDPDERKKREADRVWQFIEFRNHTLGKLRDHLNDRAAIEAYRNDPFNPHAIARLRLGAYMKNIVMKYIDNLLDWGDHLFAQDTMESINEATLLYVMAAEILGPRPAELGDCPERTGEQQTFDQIDLRMHQAGDSDFAAEMETLASDCRDNSDISSETSTDDVTWFGGFGAAAWVASSHASTGGTFYEFYHEVGHGASNGRGVDIALEDTGERDLSDAVDIDIDLDLNYFRGPDWKDAELLAPGSLLPSFGTSLLKQARIFCIPHNQDLLGYWDRVEDRLYKIRNCMNISGIRRQLSLFAPEIDPRLLVRARAVGIPLEDVLDSISGKLPPYRFSFLIVKAKEYAGAVQALGAALLGALEKKDAEELARLRLVHQDNILKLNTKLRNQEIQAAEASLEGLMRRKETITKRQKHFERILDDGLSGLEEARDDLYYIGHGAKALAIPFASIAAGAALPPSILGFSFSTPPKSIENACSIMAYVANATGELSLVASDMVNKHAGYERREEGWDFSLQQAKSELKEIEKQIEAAELRRDISIESRNIHEKTLEQLQETFEFFQDKFTKLGLYTWLSTYLQRLYRESYQNALTMARLAERAFRFERGDDTTSLLDSIYWDASHSGLLAGERLMNDLRTMERGFMETHYRGMEIDQAFSLTQIDPAALIELKETGVCEFTIREFSFDLFYPGQYRRRIKSARLTIPCVTGPYTNVSAVLSLKGSKIRKDPELGPLIDVPPTRSVTVASSTAQNDAGVFRLDFRDERYMPFEGAGAVESTWGLEMPKHFRPFDYATINDVILHISYTAEFDGLLRERVEELNATIEGTLLNFLENNSLSRVFSLRQEFSTAFHRLLHSPLEEPVPIELTDKHFPMFLQGKSLNISNASLVLGIDREALRADGGSLPTSYSLSVSVSRNGSSTSLSAFSERHKFGKLPAEAIPDTVFADFNPSAEPETISLTVVDAGNFAPETPPPSSALDETKLQDVYLYLEYNI